MIWKSIRYGFSQILDNKRIWFFYYLFNLILSIIIILPMRKVLFDFAGRSMMANRLLQGFDMTFFTEFAKEHSDVFGMWMFFIIAGAVFYWASLIFLSGGVLHVYIHELKGTLASVMGNSAKYFGRMVRLSLWSLPVLILLLCTPFIYSGIQRLIFGDDPYESVLYWGVWIKLGIRFLAIWFFAIIFDYARIHLVQNDVRKTRKSLIAAIKFVFNNFGKTIGLKALLVLAAIIALVLLQVVNHVLAGSASLIVISVFIIGQIYMIFRIGLKLLTFSSQAELFHTVESEDRMKRGDEILLAV